MIKLISENISLFMIYRNSMRPHQPHSHPPLRYWTSYNQCPAELRVRARIVSEHWESGVLWAWTHHLCSEPRGPEGLAQAMVEVPNLVTQGWAPRSPLLCPQGEGCWGCKWTRLRAASWGVWLQKWAESQEILKGKWLTLKLPPATFCFFSSQRSSFE